MLELAVEETAASQGSQFEGGTQGMTEIERELEIWREIVPSSKEANLDILGFWKNQETKLPMLANLARHVFAVPVTSASSERNL